MSKKNEKAGEIIIPIGDVTGIYLTNFGKLNISYKGKYITSLPLDKDITVQEVYNIVEKYCV